MRIAAGILCFAAVPAVLWVGVVGVRHPEMSFWRHPILLSPFARLGWGFGSAGMVLILVMIGVDVLWG